MRAPTETFDAERLLDPADGVARYLRAVRVGPGGVEHVPLAAAFGRVLARDGTADADVPADRRSTMDGFAVRSSDGAAPRRIAATVRMGAAPPVLAAGEAVRIPTGGVLPAAADAVVPIEDAGERDGTLHVDAAPDAGAYFTPRGDDMRAGDVVLRAGRRIGAPELSVLATLGLAVVPVYRRPRVAVVSTGDELIDVDAVPGTGQVRDSNRWAIAGGLAAFGCDVVHVGRARDEIASVRERIVEGLAVADAVVLTGGSSVGARDHVPAAIDGLGAPGVIVHGLRVKPGKPTALGAVGTQPVIGLPGNPASALTILDAVLGDVFAALAGTDRAARATIAGVAGAAFTGRDGWTWYVPSEVRADGVRPLPLRSAHTSLLARADGYVVVGPERSRIEPGEPVTLVRYGAVR